MTSDSMSSRDPIIAASDRYPAAAVRKSKCVKIIKGVRTLHVHFLTSLVLSTHHDEPGLGNVMSMLLTSNGNGTQFLNGAECTINIHTSSTPLN